MLKKKYFTQYISLIVLLVVSLFTQKADAQCPVSIGADTTPICIGDTVSLDPGVGFLSYTWNATAGNATTQMVDVFAAGTYIVTVDDGTITCADTTVVVINPLPVVNLGADDTLCFGEQLTVFAGTGFLNYSWQDGSVLDSFVIQTADTFHVTVEDTNGCIVSDSIIIEQHTIPTVTIGNDTSICWGDTLTIDGGAGFTSYLWSNGDVTQTTRVDTGGFYAVTITDNKGCQNSNGLTLTIDSLPDVDLGGNDTICGNPGVTHFLDAGAGFASYLWSTTGTNQTVTVSVQDTYWVEVTDTNGCINRDSMELVFRDGPIISLGNDTSICIGDSLTLDPGQGQAGYLWDNGSTDSVITIDTAGVYSVIVTDTLGCQSFDTINVGINFLPIVNLGNDLEHCAKSTLNNLVDGGAGFAAYLWMDGSVTQINTITQADDTVWVEVTDANGCRNRDTIYVLENPLPIVDIGPDDTICANETKIWNAGSGGGTFVNYSWNITSNLQSITLSFDPATLLTPTTNTYIVTVTDNNNCQNSDTADLLINPLPIPNLGNDLSFCQGDPFNVSLTPGTFASYNWNTTAATASINVGAIAAVYSVTVTDANGCVASDDINIIENLLPTPNLGIDSSFCQGTPLNVIISPGTFDSYSWEDGSVQPFLIVTVADTYRITVTDHNGCQNSDEIIFEEFPNPNFTLTGDMIFCEGDTVDQTLNAVPNVIANYGYSWSTGELTATIQVFDTGVYVITVVDNTSGCSVTDSTVIEYFPKANPDLGEDDILCEGEALELDPQVVQTGYSYLWSDGSTNPTLDIFTPGVYIVELNALNGTCLGERDTIEFELGVLPVVDLGEDRTLCQGQELKLLNKNTAFPNSTYTWQDGTTGAEYIAKETGLYQVIVTNKCGSTIDETSLQFQDCFNIWIPNTFTPNGDGNNETFGVISDQEFLEFSFVIYDRYGDVVFKTNTPYAVWDGTVNGDESPSGVYIYKMSYISAFESELKRREKIGQVNLIR